MRFLILMLLVSCATGTMVTNPNNRPKYAPKNYQQAGQVKYLNQGADFIINKRREDAFRQMYASCGGDYEIISEANQATTQNINHNGWGGLTVNNGNHYVFIDYKCIESSDSERDVAATEEKPEAKIVSCQKTSDCTDGMSCKNNVCKSLGAWGKFFNP